MYVYRSLDVVSGRNLDPVVDGVDGRQVEVMRIDRLAIAALPMAVGQISLDLQRI